MRGTNVEVRSVWAHNVVYELRLLRSLLRFYSFVSLDTEFPGVIYISQQHPSCLTVEERYALIKNNVNLLHLIQIGLCLSDAQGTVRYVWEFNISGFNPYCQLYNLDSVKLLMSRGISFGNLHYHGIDQQVLPELLLESGLLCNNNITWITFHGAYDFAYMIKCLIRRKLPERSVEFMELVRIFFGNKIYDVKNIIRYCNGIYGGLEKTASLLRVQRAAGMSHQAGSDALLTSQVFRKLRKMYFANGGGVETQAGVIFGLQVN